MGLESKMCFSLFILDPRIIFIVMKDVESAALAAAPLPLELEKLGRVIACYRTLSRVIAVIASYRGDNSVIAGPRTLRNRGARSHNAFKKKSKS